jgi:hypothetical protein
MRIETEAPLSITIERAKKIIRRRVDEYFDEGVKGIETSKERFIAAYCLLLDFESLEDQNFPQEPAKI